MSGLLSAPKQLRATSGAVAALRRQVETTNLLVGRLFAQRVRDLGPNRPLQDAEFRVFSQWGDDGIIQYLLAQVTGLPQTFVEFGVEDYSESNTRFLLLNDNWRGLIMDGSREHMESVRRSDLYWRHDLTALDAFITKENINELIRGAGFQGPIGLLSVDIDGNDYWVWEALTVVDPVIVIVEYNSVFGSSRALSVPYDPAFRRSAAHSSNLYWGCSVRALCLLAKKKGYVFVGCNANGNNAYFVKADRAERLRALSPEVGYVESRFRESRDPQGQLTFLAGRHRRTAIADMSVVDVETMTSVKLGDVA